MYCTGSVLHFILHTIPNSVQFRLASIVFWYLWTHMHFGHGSTRLLVTSLVFLMAVNVSLFLLALLGHLCIYGHQQLLLSDRTPIPLRFIALPSVCHRYLNKLHMDQAGRYIIDIYEVHEKLLALKNRWP